MISRAFSRVSRLQMSKCLVFDLDGTLYDINNGYLQHIRSNIFKMMVAKKYGQTPQEAETLWKPLFKKHNQSYKGLREGGYPFEPDEYWVNHRAGVENYFAKDVALSELLLALPHKKVIFTNCREKEAIQIMKLMGIDNCFDAVYGSDFMGDICKPQKESFELLFDELQLSPKDMIYFEDSVKNLCTAQQLGMECVLINSPTAGEEGSTIVPTADEYRCSIDGFSEPITVITSLNDGGTQLRSALPDLFIA